LVELITPARYRCVIKGEIPFRLARGRRHYAASCDWLFFVSRAPDWHNVKSKHVIDTLNIRYTGRGFASAPAIYRLVVKPGLSRYVCPRHFLLPLLLYHERDQMVLGSGLLAHPFSSLTQAALSKALW
jgi:hypothetical protein